MVEEGEREAGDKGVYPHPHAGQLHGERVQVHAVDAAARDQAPQERGVLYLDGVGEMSEGSFGGLPQQVEFPVYVRDLVVVRKLV